MITAFICAHALAIDGDTLACSNRPEHIRLARIDAPEMPGHCRRGRSCAPGDPIAARDALTALLDRGELRCEPVSASPRGGSPFDRYGRIVARCTVAGVDVGEEQLRTGHAIQWPHS
ncbi:thermonuclease family protein [Sphingomonas oligoaromativorans]|uniref:thermonuclease family protein n=1 Tax=Sphingomonas oligoaromativorans TaxID=575322 RepID=UPI0014206C05|nr:thermonuclease family protein [Sphingomonas oligoaromativorans]NIJ34306.1 endonuclease YncB(thermonuclease family) [Sphingomonas oligoaromativorans]